jgi:hypothetical protein
MTTPPISAVSLDNEIGVRFDKFIDKRVTGVSCKSFSAMSGSTGDVSLSGVIAEESLSVKRTTGDIEITVK